MKLNSPRRLTLGLGLALASAGLLTACGPKPEDTPPPSAPEPVETAPPTDNMTPPAPAPTDPATPPTDPTLPPPPIRTRRKPPRRRPRALLRPRRPAAECGIRQYFIDDTTAASCRRPFSWAYAARLLSFAAFLEGEGRADDGTHPLGRFRW